MILTQPMKELHLVLTLSHNKMLTTQPHFSTGFPHLAEIFVENSVYLKWLIKCNRVLFNSS